MRGAVGAAGPGWSPARARVVPLDLDDALANVEEHVDHCRALEEARRAAGPVPEVEVPRTPWGRCALEAMRLLVARDPAVRIEPSPDQVTEALRLLGAEPAEAVMVGDSGWDEVAARAAGAPFIGLSLGRRRHGSGDGSVVVRDLEEAAAILRGGGVGRAARARRTRPG